ARLKERGLSLTTGKSIHVYAAHFPPHSEDCPTSAKHLQKLANGTYQRASVAYKLLISMLKPDPIGRQKAVWFIDIEETFVKHTLDHCNAIWDQFDSEVQQLAQSRASIAEAKFDELTTELHQVEDYVDELLSTNEQQLSTISNLNAEVELVRRHEGTITQLNKRLDEKESKLKDLTSNLDEYHLLARDMAAKTAEINRLEQHIEALKSSNKSLQKSYEVELKRNGMLDGQLQLLKPLSCPEHQAAIDMVEGMYQPE
ncbi:hypothetical protein, partial [Vibrio cyclitrophicus]